MSSLVGLDKVEGVKNEVHRGVLVALRDTDLSVKEIADSLGIASYSVYDIAHRYLYSEQKKMSFLFTDFSLAL